MDESDEASGHVFLSYVREDSRNVDYLHRSLESAGIRVWHDTTELWPGEDWRARIREAIGTNAFVFVACFSRQSNGRASSYQNEELILAIDELRRRPAGDHWLIPVRFDDCDIPDHEIGAGRTLRSLHRADLFGDNAADGADKLIAAIRRIIDRRRADSGAAPVLGSMTASAEPSGAVPAERSSQAADASLPGLTPVDISDAGIVTIFGNVTLRGKYVAARDLHIDESGRDSQDD